MNSKPLHILMLEDDDMDAELLELFLKKSLNILIKIVSTKKDYLNALEKETFDVILSDHNLPQFSSLEALRIKNQKRLLTPFILVSGKIPEEYAVSMLQEGANDYILKDRPQRLPSAILEAIDKQNNLVEKLKAEEELINTNERLKLVLKATDDAIWDWNAVTDEIIWGEGLKTVFGYEPSEHATFESWARHLYRGDRKRVIKKILESNQNPAISNWSDEFKYVKSDNSIAIVISKGIILRDSKGVVTRMVGAMQDVTELRQLEKELFDSKISRQKEIAETTLKAQEKERNEMGKELHDNINQLLASSKMLIEAGLRSPEMHDICLQKSIEALSIAIIEVRNLSHSMITPSLENGQLLNAINQIIDNVNLSGNIKAKFIINDPLRFEKTPGEIKLTAYRIIQEQVNNVLKYSKANSLSISLTLSDRALEMIIKDDGIGFDAEKKQTGVGLRNIGNRAELYGGKMEIITSPGKGCTIKVHLPLKK